MSRLREILYEGSEIDKTNKELKSLGFNISNSTITSGFAKKYHNQPMTDYFDTTTIENSDKQDEQEWVIDKWGTELKKFGISW